VSLYPDYTHGYQPDFLSDGLRDDQPDWIGSDGACAGVAPRVQPAPRSAGTPIRWHAVRTVPSEERNVARALGRAGIELYLPLVDIFREESTRTRCVTEVLFDKHLFLHGDDDAVQYAWTMQRVADIRIIDDQKRFKNELEHIRRAVHSGAILLPAEYLTEGRRMRIVGGQCTGVEGIVELWGAPLTLNLQITALTLATSLAIDFDRLEPID
jgi:hypothetical protein